LHGDVALAADVHYSSCQRGAHSWLAGQLRPGSTDVLQVVEVEDWRPEGIPKWQPDQRSSSGGRPNYSVRRPLVLAILAIAAGCRRTARRARAELEQRLRRHLKPTNKSWRSTRPTFECRAAGATCIGRSIRAVPPLISCFRRCQTTVSQRVEGSIPSHVK
jgi:hypothetical protein